MGTNYYAHLVVGYKLKCQIEKNKWTLPENEDEIEIDMDWLVSNTNPEEPNIYYTNIDTEPSYLMGFSICRVDSYDELQELEILANLAPYVENTPPVIRRGVREINETIKKLKRFMKNEFQYEQDPCVFLIQCVSS